MSYQILDEDEKSYKVKHADGSEFKVAKKGLNKQVLEKIAKQYPKIPRKMAEGGIAGESDDESTFDAPSSKSAEQLNQETNGLMNQGIRSDSSGPVPAGQVNMSPSDFGKYPDLNSPEAVSDIVSSANASSPGSQTSQPSSPGPSGGGGGGAFGTMDPGSLMNKAFGNEMSGMKDVANAKSQEAQGIGQAYDQWQQASKAANDSFQQNTKQILDENQKIAQTPIDPRRVWSNMSTGNKIAAGVGIMIGGIHTIGNNPSNGALDAINKAVNDDINSQKEQKNSLWNANLMKYKNAQVADAATRLQINGMLQGTLAKTAAQSQSVQAQAAVKTGIAALQMQAVPYAQQIAQYHTLGQMMGTGSQGGGMPTGSLPPMMAEKYGKQMVDSGGKTYLAKTEKGAEEINKMQTLYRPIVDDVNLIKGLGSSALIDPDARSRAQAAMNRIAMNLNEFNGYKRFTDTDKDTIQHMFNDPSAIKSIFTNQGATADTLKSLQTKLESEKANSLHGYKGMTGYNTKAYGAK